MRNALIIDDMRTGYLELVDWVRSTGREVAPRGYRTWEIEDAVFKLNDPTDALPIGVGRRPKLAIGAAEALLLCSGLASPSLLTEVSPTFRRFLDGGDLHGGYGRRIGMQLPRVVERLRQDPDSRQAIVSIWDPLYDMQDSRDVPCTLNFNFRIRNGRLNMSTAMRSNDVWLGAAYDVFMFTQLQCTIAHALGIDVGTYTHHAYSFHIYERNLEAVEKLHAFDAREATDDHKDFWNTRPVGFGRVSDAIPKIMSRARDIYDGVEPTAPTASEQWYMETLRPYSRLSATANFTA